MRDEEKSDTSIRLGCKKPAKVSLGNCGLELEDAKLHITDYDNLTPNELKLLNLERVELKGKNWQGAGVTGTPVLSPDGRRGLTFKFCLAYKGLILTGYMSNAGYPQLPKESAMPNIIKLLEGIEFVDDSASNDAASENAR